MDPAKMANMSEYLYFPSFYVRIAVRRFLRSVFLASPPDVGDSMPIFFLVFGGHSRFVSETAQSSAV
jgi:hypothetical protein